MTPPALLVEGTREQKPLAFSTDIRGCRLHPLTELVPRSMRVATESSENDPTARPRWDLIPFPAVLKSVHPDALVCLEAPMREVVVGRTVHPDNIVVPVPVPCVR